MTTTESPKPFSAAVQELNTLIHHGTEQGRWFSKEQCGNVLGVKAKRLRRLANGESTDQAVLQISNQIRTLLETPQPEQEKSDPNKPKEFDALFSEGQRLGLWNNFSECSRAVLMSRCSFQKLRQANPDTLSLREKKFLEKILKKMRDLIDARRAGPEVATPSPPSSPDARPESNVVIERIDRLEATMRSLLPGDPGKEQRIDRTAPSEDPSVPSSWLQDVVAGRREIAGQGIPGVRFVLTNRPIARLLTSFRKEEVTDTVQLTETITLAITELRRRLTLIPQLGKAEDRAESIKPLVPALTSLIKELVALAITTNEAREIDVNKAVIRAALHFESLGNIFSLSNHDRSQK